MKREAKETFIETVLDGAIPKKHKKQKKHIKSRKSLENGSPIKIPREKKLKVPKKFDGKAEETALETAVFDGTSPKKHKIYNRHLKNSDPFKIIKKDKLTGVPDNFDGDENNFSQENTLKGRNNVAPKKKSVSKNKLEYKKGDKGFSGMKPFDKKSAAVDKKVVRMEQKILKRKRREKDRGYAIPAEASKIFEELRCKKCLPERSVTLSHELFSILSGKILSAVRSHDLTRMIQWLIKVGPPEIRQKVLDEVIVDTVNLCKTKYSNHIVLRILKDCDKGVRKKILSYFLGNIAALARNRFGAPVIEEYYCEHAKRREKAYMRQELYSDLFRGAKNPSLTSLSEVFNQNPTLKSAILKSTKAMLSKIIQKKSAVQTNLVCDVLYDYLQHSEEQDKLDLLELLKANIACLLKNKTGARVLMYLLWESTAKVKKLIVKELKSNILSLAKSSSYLFILSLFDCVDDTVLIKKAILAPLLDNAEELVKNTYGRKVVFYLVAHRDTTYFHPKDLEELQKADESSNVKKDISIKEKELLEPCVNVLLMKIKENPDFWFSDASTSLVTLAILQKASGEALFETYKVVSEFFLQNMLDGESKIVKDAGIQMVLKKLIKLDPVESEEYKFATYITNSLSIENVRNLILFNRGCFLLVNLIETNIEYIFEKIKHIIKKGKLKPELHAQDTKGAELLKKVILKESI